jgi:hypothetical protein
MRRWNTPHAKSIETAWRFKSSGTSIDLSRAIAWSEWEQVATGAGKRLTLELLLGLPPNELKRLATWEARIKTWPSLLFEVYRRANSRLRIEDKPEVIVG